MKARFFRSVRFKNDFELNFIGKVWSLRIGRSQFSLWRNYEPVFSFVRRWPGGAWWDPVMPGKSEW